MIKKGVGAQYGIVAFSEKKIRPGKESRNRISCWIQTAAAGSSCIKLFAHFFCHVVDCLVNNLDLVFVKA